MKERKLYSLTGKLIVFLLLIVFAASALFGMAACGSSSADGEKKIRIGIKYDQPGLGFKKSGTFEGFDAECGSKKVCV